MSEFINGQPENIYNEEWFIARLKNKELALLRFLPSEFTYDYRDAFDNYLMKDWVVAYMPMPNSEFKTKHELNLEQKLKEKDEQIKELESIEREHHYLISKIDKLFGKNKGEHNYFDTIVRVRKQLKKSNELLKEACKYLQQETDLGKETAKSYGVDSKMFCYYEFLNKPEVKKIMGGSD